MLQRSRAAIRHTDDATARLLFEQFGAGAVRYAADRLSGQTDIEQRERWRRLFRRLSDLVAAQQG